MDGSLCGSRHHHTGDSFTGDEALISGATVSSDAIRVATEDAFAAFAAVNENGGEIG